MRSDSATLTLPPLSIRRICNQRNGERLYKQCDRSNAEGLASRTQLAMELFPDEPDKLT